MSIAEELAKKHIPPHNAIDPDRPEGHYDCEECADIVFAHAVDAINEALELAAQEAENIGRLAVAGDTGREAARFAAERIRRMKSPATPQEP